ncbi:hypothetical protein F4774DRAFT_423028 [Daldinia eschscholtzii]|nr:hypothetical protein F4774DRAFT_423028 [Daldinia eschscholtzii]
MSQEPQGESSTQPRTADEDPVELENLDELRELVKFCPGWIKDPTRHFDHMAVRWETIDPRTATAKQKATWALLTLADLETTDLNASYARTPSEVLSFYQERFRDFTVADFDSMPDKVRSGLRLALMQRGIYAGRGNANFSGVLASLLVMNDLPTWNADELESAKFRWPDALAWRTSVHQTDKGPAYPEAPESIHTGPWPHARTNSTGPTPSAALVPNLPTTSATRVPTSPAATPSPQQSIIGVP